MKLTAVFSEVFAIPSEAVKDELVLQDIPQWDSMTHMVLIIRIEETWGIQFDGDEIADLRTVGDARRMIKAHGGET
jgi:acyl carrier protein